jgi:RES domain-containing protein
MIVYRVTQTRYKDDLSGEGASRYGGRWNSKGVPLLYTSDSRALCTLEVAVHLPLSILPAGYVMLEIELPDEAAIEVVEISELPDNWLDFPPPPTLRDIGDRFASERSAPILKVPSAVVPGDFNYLLNPLHPDYVKVAVRGECRFHFDKRLLR